MNHFGMALGVIIVTVIGGAIVLDRTVSSPQPTAVKTSASPAAVPVLPNETVVDTSASVRAPEPPTPPAKVASLTPSSPRIARPAPAPKPASSNPAPSAELLSAPAAPPTSEPVAPPSTASTSEKAPTPQPEG